VVFRATIGKWHAAVVEITRMNKPGRPVLVGTTSVEQSEALSEQLLEAGIPHEVSCQLPSISFIFFYMIMRLVTICFFSFLCLDRAKNSVRI
jgi:hypothetical protein